MTEPTPQQIAQADQAWMVARPIGESLLHAYVVFRTATPEAHPMALPGEILEYLAKVPPEAKDTLITTIMYLFDGAIDEGAKMYEKLTDMGVVIDGLHPGESASDPA